MSWNLNSCGYFSWVKKYRMCFVTGIISLVYTDISWEGRKLLSFEFSLVPFCKAERHDTVCVYECVCVLPYLQERLQLVFNICDQTYCVRSVQLLQSKAASASKILHFVTCERSCALQWKSKYCTQNQTWLHSSLVKGWQLWTQSDCRLVS